MKQNLDMCGNNPTEQCEQALTEIAHICTYTSVLNYVVLSVLNIVSIYFENNNLIGLEPFVKILWN